MATVLVVEDNRANLAMKGDEERIRSAGCDGYVAKPLACRDFLAIIAAHLMTSPRSVSTSTGLKI